MREVEDEPLFAERAAGIDIAKAGIEVTIRVPSDTRPDSVRGVCEVLGVKEPNVKSFWAFFPKGLEDELDRKEKGYRNRRPEEAIPQAEVFFAEVRPLEREEQEAAGDRPAGVREPG